MMEQKVLIELTEKENEELISALEALKRMSKIIGKPEIYHVASKLLEKLRKKAK